MRQILIAFALCTAFLSTVSFVQENPARKIKRMKDRDYEGNAVIRQKKNLEVYARTEERKLFSAKDATQAVLTIPDGFVEISSSTKPSRDKQLNVIEEQLWHMFGTMSAASLYAVPKGDHRVSLSEKAPEKLGPNRWRSFYKYEGTILVKENPLVRNSRNETYEVIVPINPKTIYNDSLKRGSDFNVCTDDHYNTEDDFWYFWNPHMNEQCRELLKENVHYKKFAGKLKRIKNTPQSWPEYPKLARKGQDGTTILPIRILLGLDKPQKGRNPHRSADLNAATYRDVYEDLAGGGPNSLRFENSEIPRAERERILGKTGQDQSKYHWERLVKRFPKRTSDGKDLVVQVDLFFGPSGIDENDNEYFHYLYRDSLENSSMVLYDGHSGLGGHLDLESIEGLRRRRDPSFTFAFNPKLYQVYYFNSCTSYRYYNSTYFAKKGGGKPTEYLDILNNGLATEFSVLHETNMALIRAVHSWADNDVLVTYQDLAKMIDSENLFAVNGDEDKTNQARPSRKV